MSVSILVNKMKFKLMNLKDILNNVLKIHLVLINDI